MFPDPIFSIFNLYIFPYDILNAVGLLLALALALFLAREHGGIPLKNVLIVWFACAIAQYALAPVLVRLVEQLGFNLPLGWSFMRMVAMFIALVGVKITWFRATSVPLSDSLDIAAPPMLLFIAFARLGNLTIGGSYGAPAPGLPWAITFTNPASLAWRYLNIPVHPTQLYEAFGVLAILGVVLGLRHRAMWRGNLMWLTLLLYSIMRFGIEFYRGDLREMVGLLSLNQVICIALALASGAILAWKFQRIPLKRGT
jgi:phosphatidylglycerol:prolipoprotein diacylglycerol transferase